MIVKTKEYVTLSHGIRNIIAPHDVHLSSLTGSLEDRMSLFTFTKNRTQTDILYDPVVEEAQRHSFAPVSTSYIPTAQLTPLETIWFMWCVGVSVNIYVAVP